MTTYDTHRCVECGCPAVDHVPALRYVLKAWLLHKLRSLTWRSSTST